MVGSTIFERNHEKEEKKKQMKNLIRLRRKEMKWNLRILGMMKEGEGWWGFRAVLKKKAKNFY